MIKHIMWLIALVFLPLTTNAQTPPYCEVKFDPNAETYFVNSIQEAKDALVALCKATQSKGISADELNGIFLVFHRNLAEDAATAMPDLVPFLGIYRGPLFDVTGDVATGLVPDFIVDRPDPITINGLTLYAQGRGTPIITKVPKANAAACLNDKPCNTAFAAYMNILKTVYNPLSEASLAITSDFLSVKDKEWTTYIEESRSQTFIDIAVTSTLYEWKYGKEENDFTSPPTVQWFALHPSIIIENVSGAIDGDETKESLALEVIGFNYWEDACFWVACGASVIVNYADRNGVDDTGWGLMFHVDNSYSFGVTKHGGEEGFFITVDLLKLFQDKKSSFDDYKEKYRKFGE